MKWNSKLEKKKWIKKYCEKERIRDPRQETNKKDGRTTESKKDFEKRADSFHPERLFGRRRSGQKHRDSVELKFKGVWNVSLLRIIDVHNFHCAEKREHVRGVALPFSSVWFWTSISFFVLLIWHDGFLPFT